jgi:RND family efflux transporter MFP subunit
LASKVLTRVVLPLVVIGAGAFGARMMTKMAPKATRTAAEAQVLLVEIVTAHPTDVAARIASSGVVEPGARVTIVPEVTGRVTRLADDLVPGGRVRKGDLLLKIDPREYELAIKQQSGQLKGAELGLEQELGRQHVAQREWEILGKDQQGAHKSLVLREPHLAAAKEQVQTVQSAIDRAQLNLSRTTIKAPFNASVVSEEVELGQVVSPGRSVATLIGADQFWVRASLPIELLDLIDIPGVAQDGPAPSEGSAARVSQELAGSKRLSREGRILRLESQMDTQTRTAVVVIGVDPPLDPPGGGLPLLPGAFVRVEIEGKTRSGVTVLPARAIHGGNQVWVANAENRLERRNVAIGFSTADEAHVIKGVEDGARVVVSPLALPIEGMEVRVSDAAPQAKAPPPPSSETPMKRAPEATR